MNTVKEVGQFEPFKPQPIDPADYLEASKTPDINLL
jgi:hypothetical protein